MQFKREVRPANQNPGGHGATAHQRIVLVEDKNYLTGYKEDGQISCEAPLGLALLEHEESLQVGDILEVKVSPGKRVNYLVLEKSEKITNKKHNN